MATPIKWEDADFKWELSPTDGTKPRYTWDDVSIVTEIVVEIQQGATIEEVIGGDTEKKKRLIKLICKVQGRKIKQTKEINDYKIKVSDIKMLAKEVLNIEVLTENIKF